MPVLLPERRRSSRLQQMEQGRLLPEPEQAKASEKSISGLKALSVNNLPTWH
jgi:hypothetical protein